MRTRMSANHVLLGGKLHVYKRENSRYWQCSAFFNGRNHRASTKEEGLSQAKDFAEDWFLELKGKVRRGEAPGGGVTFAKAADQFIREFVALTAGFRSPEYVKGHEKRLRVHLLPFFGKKALTDITPGVVQEYRIHRMTSRKDVKTGEPKRPARSTLHQEMVCLRQVLKCANRQGWIPFLPDLSDPFRKATKIAHRAWFSPSEYKQLYQATRARVTSPKRARYKWEYEQLHDYVLFMANTGLRPDEAARLEYRDVTIVDDDATNETILEIEVRGKRGVGYCKSTNGAVLPFERLMKRNNPKPTDKLFPKGHRELLNTILEEENLKFDREKNRRTAYSLRHTYICLRLMEGADIYQIAKNCRTSVEMIEKYYASHIKTSLDAAAINIRKPKKPTSNQKGKKAKAEEI